MAVNVKPVRVTLVSILITLTLVVCAAEEPQPFSAVTEMFPPVKLEFAVIEFVVEVPVHVEGSVHEYDVASATATMLYVFELSEQTDVFPLITPRVPGAVWLAVTLSV